MCGGPRYSPGETGWVLFLSGTREAVEPQALSVDDVLGDLRSMMPNDDSVTVMVRLATEEMIETLEAGNVSASKYPDEISAAARLRELREELREALGGD